MAKKKKSTNKNQLVTALVLVVLAGIITTKLQNTTFSTFFFAKEKASCNMSCTRDNQCQSGLTCQFRLGSKTSKICTCNGKNCIRNQCIESQAKAELGSECYQSETLKDRRGGEVTIPHMACKVGLQCLFVPRLNGSSYVCCDPSNPTSHPQCIPDPLRGVAPLP